MPPSLAEHTDIFWPMLGGLLAFVGLLLTGYGIMAKVLINQILKSLTATQEATAKSLEELWRQFAEVRDDFHIMRGEHEREMGSGGRRYYDPAERYGRIPHANP